jgi:hypothetical protein
MAIRSRQARLLGVGVDVVGIKREDAVGPEPRGERQDVVSSMSQFGTFLTWRDVRLESVMRFKADAGESNTPPYSAR